MQRNHNTKKEATPQQQFQGYVSPVQSDYRQDSPTPNSYDNAVDVNIKVVVRVRPLNIIETRRGDGLCVKVGNDGETLQFNSLTNMKTQGKPQQAGQPNVVNKTFTFDKSFDEYTTQEQMFSSCGVKELIDLAIQGFSTTVFAYGQTGSGKTFTIAGDDTNNLQNGIVPRATSYIFECVNQMRQQGINVSVNASYLEIWNEQINDLLNLQSINLPVRFGGRGFFVESLIVVECFHYDDMMLVVQEGISNRKVSSHDLNKDSSRSHSIFTVQFVVEYPDPMDPYGSSTSKRSGKIHFVDLAGSERLKESKAKGAAAVETAHINKSLLTLGKVIRVLSDPKHDKSVFVPYRDSKLTQLLMDSIGGGIHTTLKKRSTHFSMQTAAKKIKNKPFVTVDPKEEYIYNLKSEISALREQVSSLQAASTPPSDLDRASSSDSSTKKSNRRSSSKKAYKLNSGASSLFEIQDGENNTSTVIEPKEHKLKTLDQVVDGVNVDRSISSLSGIGSAMSGSSGSYYPPLDPQFASIVAQKERLEAEMKDLKTLLAQSNSHIIPNKSFIANEQDAERVRAENIEMTKALTSLKQLLQQREERVKKEKQASHQLNYCIQEYENKLSQLTMQHSLLQERCEQMKLFIQEQGLHYENQQQELHSTIIQQQEHLQMANIDEEEYDRIKREHKYLMMENQYLKRMFLEKNIQLEQYDPDNKDHSSVSTSQEYDSSFRGAEKEQVVPFVKSIKNSRPSSVASSLASLKQQAVEDSQVFVEDPPVVEAIASISPPSPTARSASASATAVVDSDGVNQSLAVETVFSSDSVFGKNPVTTPMSVRGKSPPPPDVSPIAEKKEKAHVITLQSPPPGHTRHPKERPRKQENIELPEVHVLNVESNKNKENSVQSVPTPPRQTTPSSQPPAAKPLSAGRDSYGATAAKRRGSAKSKSKMDSDKQSLDQNIVRDVVTTPVDQPDSNKEDQIPKDVEPTIIPDATSIEKDTDQAIHHTESAEAASDVKPAHEVIVPGELKSEPKQETIEQEHIVEKQLDDRAENHVSPLVNHIENEQNQNEKMPSKPANSKSKSKVKKNKIKDEETPLNKQDSSSEVVPEVKNAPLVQHSDSPPSDVNHVETKQHIEPNQTQEPATTIQSRVPTPQMHQDESIVSITQQVKSRPSSGSTTTQNIERPKSKSSSRAATPSTLQKTDRVDAIESHSDKNTHPNADVKNEKEKIKNVEEEPKNVKVEKKTEEKVAEAPKENVKVEEKPKNEVEGKLNVKVEQKPNSEHVKMEEKPKNEVEGKLNVKVEQKPNSEHVKVEEKQKSEDVKVEQKPSSEEIKVEEKQKNEVEGKLNVKVEQKSKSEDIKVEQKPKNEDANVEGKLNVKVEQKPKSEAEGKPNVEKKIENVVEKKTEEKVDEELKNEKEKTKNVEEEPKNVKVEKKTEEKVAEAPKENVKMEEKPKSEDVKVEQKPKSEDIKVEQKSKSEEIKVEKKPKNEDANVEGKLNVDVKVEGKVEQKSKSEAPKENVKTEEKPKNEDAKVEGKLNVDVKAEQKPKSEDVKVVKESEPLPKVEGTEPDTQRT
ncbi:kinesin-like protein [Acrasis kona]|uniref:Kinesin-like protein n=1 Tax=Acrasis kona TaxID=1008807 RepID=A0AAW2Z6K8_9EUKA